MNVIFKRFLKFAVIVMIIGYIGCASVPKEVVDKITHGSEKGKPVIEELKTITLLNIDIRGFSQLAKQIGSQKTVSLLNSFFSVMGGIVFKHRGIVDKYLGDGFLSLFGAPVSSTTDADNAIAAAIEMKKAMSAVNRFFKRELGTEVSMGISIHTGEVVVGNIGFDKKMDYTVIGDSVNLASRLEGLTKHYQSTIIVSEKVKESTAEVEAIFRELDTVKVKGKSKPTSIFSLEINSGIASNEEAQKNWYKAMSMYKMKNWETAKEYFQLVFQAIPEDFLSTMYIQRCGEYLQNPPPLDWDGSIELDFK